MKTLLQLNQLSNSEFIQELGGIYEHSPWVAERALSFRPFESRDQLIQTLRHLVDTANDAEKLQLIQAHPDLAGKLARSGALTADSSREQAGLGLDRLTEEEYDRISALNAAYTEQFGFPFILCARLTTRSSMMDVFQKRLLNEREAELIEALQQIHQIARLRLEDRIR